MSKTRSVAAILKAAQTSRYYPALALITATGLRRGEALALVWDTSIVNLDEGWLKVRKTLGRVNGALKTSEPKTERSRRTVPLSPAVVAMLRRHKAGQSAEKLRAGNQWHDSGLVFTTELGGPVDPRNLLRVIEVAAKAAGVDGAVCTRSVTRRPWLGWSRVCISRLWLICSGTRRSLSPVMSTAIPVTKPPGPRSTAGAELSDCEHAFDKRCATCCATYPSPVCGKAVPDVSETALTCLFFGRADSV